LKVVKAIEIGSCLVTFHFITIVDSAGHYLLVYCCPSKNKMVLWVVEENSDSLVHRMLQAARPDQSAVVSMPTGTLVILITVGFIVCCVW